MSKKETTVENNLENVEHALGRTEKFIEDNQKTLTIILLALIVLVGGYWAYKKFYEEPRNTEAQKSLFQAQQYFGNEEFQLALEGDGMESGFLDVIENSGGTQAGKLARYYAGISYLHLGDYESAIDYLKQFKTSNEELKSLAQGAIGDAYLELGNQAEALKQYNKAIAVNNAVTAPFYLMKKGLVLEAGGDKEGALESFQTIKDDFSESVEARQIDKYITRVSL
ncbi:YfgM family protein [Geofilum rhodophaeum]|uniref:YfgM family protein n=1 Tax=Geofilum rhodophaeum TaxID=1965019 RepID=UPI000B524176|nr:tetratricopeptide repeat protein [Geofilum rhodophaeum]